jgi:hypothetical protein
MNIAGLKFGEQIWMAENLAYLPTITDSAFYSDTVSCYYVYDYFGEKVSDAKATYYYDTYGVFYN